MRKGKLETHQDMIGWDACGAGANVKSHSLEVHTMELAGGATYLALRESRIFLCDPLSAPAVQNISATGLVQLLFI